MENSVLYTLSLTVVRPFNARHGPHLTFAIGSEKLEPFKNDYKDLIWWARPPSHRPNPVVSLSVVSAAHPRC